MASLPICDGNASVFKKKRVVIFRAQNSLTTTVTGLRPSRTSPTMKGVRGERYKISAPKHSGYQPLRTTIRSCSAGAGYLVK